MEVCALGPPRSTAGAPCEFLPDRRRRRRGDQLPSSPAAWFTTAQNPPRLVPGLNPGSPKDCGLEIISGRHFPDDWQGNLITNDFRGHRVCRYIVTPEGAGFVSREQKEVVIKSNHPAFRPIRRQNGAGWCAVHR